MQTSLALDVSAPDLPTPNDLPAPKLTLAEINTFELVSIEVDRTGQTIATLRRDGRELDLDGLGHFMDMVEQSRGPWIDPSSAAGVDATGTPQYWQQLLRQSTRIFGQRARAVADAIQTLDALQGSLPALVQRLETVLRDHAVTNGSTALTKMFRGG